MFNDILFWDKLDVLKKKQMLLRPIVKDQNNIKSIVKKIIKNVSQLGDESLLHYTYLFDSIKLKTIQVSEEVILKSFKNISCEFKNAILHAKKNIERFHCAQRLQTAIDIEVESGLRCSQMVLPIKSVGLYVPGGSASLCSTVLMLGIPARLAGCKKIILCSPPPISDQILATAYLCNINTIYQIGGAQAIAAMSCGTESVYQVDKIFGPGNAYVTEAKLQVSKMIEGSSIDMLAGPSEVLIIADDNANPDFIASDLLSQAEHGIDSQVILLTTSLSLTQLVMNSIKHQIKGLPRYEIIISALKHSRFIVANDLMSCVKISNSYGPEHLILNLTNYKEILSYITNAGSIFLGPWSPVSVGDYISGTNHVLPTYGYSSKCSGLSLVDFQKRVSVQELTFDGLLRVANSVQLLSDVEQMTAHKRSVSIRLESLKGKI
ncbi:MAG: histidinol dehydrogenase [Buchnera aphidicola (Eriosoma harunire)]